MEHHYSKTHAVNIFKFSSGMHLFLLFMTVLIFFCGIPPVSAVDSYSIHKGMQLLEYY